MRRTWRDLDPDVLGPRIASLVFFVGATAPHPISTGNFLSGLVAGLFAFGGWHMVTYASDETVDPHTTIPRALLIGTLIVTAAYLAMNAVYLYVLPLAIGISIGE